MKSVGTENAEKRAGGVSAVWHVWIVMTAVVAVVTAAVSVFAGAAGLRRAVQEGPLSIWTQTMASVAVLWGAFGAVLVAMRSRRMRFRYGLTAVLAFVLLALAVNILRERIHYVDVTDYVQAARDLQNGVAFHGRYIYPPMLAMLVRPMLVLGERGAEGALWLLNLVSYVLFYFLLVRTLERYAFGQRLAPMLAFVFLLLNVPAMRTLAYVQVNFHVMNLVLLCFLLYPRHRVWSAVCLAAAVNLKGAPGVMALPFLWIRDWRWVGAFVLSGLAVAGVTFGLWGSLPFESFLVNARNVYAVNGVCLRECSLDALVRSTAWVFGGDGTRWVWLVKGPVLAALAFGVVWSVRWGAWKNRRDQLGVISNSVPLLFGLMVFVSPLVWEHHFVFLAVPFLLVFKKLSTPEQGMVYLFAWLFVFAMPTFDFWPWSFCRMAGAFALLGLCVKVCGRQTAPWFGTFRGRINKLLDYRGGYVPAEDS